MRKLSCSILLVLLLVAGFVYSALGQTATGTIFGTVTDASGAVVGHATVTITNRATSAVRTLSTNEAGLYTAPGLDAGSYSVRVEQRGFKTVTLDAVVQAGSNSAADIHLTIGDVSETVTVTSATPEIDYQGHAVGGVVEQKSIESIPTNGRSFVQLASLQPGVT